MLDFWDQRFSSDEFVYGKLPNEKFRDFIDSLKPGKILLPAEGEGRNGVYAATKDWEVDAVDFSTAGKDKALKLAKEKNVSIRYFVQDVLNFVPGKNDYDLVALIYLHLPSSTRKLFHRKVMTFLKTGGLLFLQAYDKEQINMNSGGPKNPDMLYSLEDLLTDFEGYSIHKSSKELIDHHEGNMHHGKAYNLTMIVKK